VSEDSKSKAKAELVANTNEIETKEDSKSKKKAKKGGFFGRNKKKDQK